MNLKQAQAVEARMTKCQLVDMAEILGAMRAYSLEITRLSGLLADEILVSEDLGRDLDVANNWPSESGWPPEILSVEELIKEEDYEDPIT